MESLGLISAIVAVISLVLMLVLALRGRQFSRPVVSFELGISHAYADEVPIDLHKESISMIVYGVELKTLQPGFITIPYLLENTGRLPVQDIRLALEYPSKYMVLDYSFLDKVSGEAIWKSDKIAGRTVQPLGEISQVTYEIPLVRPGEKVLISDLIVFIRTPKQTGHDSIVMDRSEEALLLKRLGKIDKFAGRFVIRAYLYSQNCAPIKKQKAILWFGANTVEELQELLGEYRKALWGGRFPMSGIYFWPLFWKPLFKKEYIEFVVPAFLETYDVSHRRIYIESPLESDGGLMELEMLPSTFTSRAGLNVEPYRVEWLSRLSLYLKSRRNRSS